MKDRSLLTLERPAAPTTTRPKAASCNTLRILHQNLGKEVIAQAEVHGTIFGVLVQAEMIGTLVGHKLTSSP
jgi:hypothetical protein